MFWDGTIILIATILAINAWNRGIINCWRGPIAMVLAIFIVQQYYIDFAFWLSQHLRISPLSSVCSSYLILWIAIESILELIMDIFIKGGVQHKPGFFNRFFGIFWGLFKACVVAILPLMAISAEIKIPPSAPNQPGLIFPDFITKEGSLIPGLKNVAKTLMPICGQHVVSTKAPNIKPEEKSQVK